MRLTSQNTVQRIDHWLSEVSLSRADQCFIAGDLESACHYLQNAIRWQPCSAAMQATLGAMRYQLGDYELARQALYEATLLQPDCASHFTKLAATHLKLGHASQFEELIQKALELDAQDTDALKLLAAQRLAQQRFFEAAQLYYRVIALRPADTTALLALGKCFYRLADRQTARIVFQRVLEIDPNNELARENLAQTQASEAQILSLAI